MPVLKPFQAFLAKPGFTHLVAANSSDYKSERALVADLRNNPNSYLRMSKNHLLKDGGSQISAEFFKNAKVCFDYLIDTEVVDRFKDDIFFVYRQTALGVSHTGIIGLCDILDYNEDRIKKHEHTRPTTENFLANYIDATQVIGEPVLLSHHHKQSLEDFLRWIIQGEPTIDYTKNEKRHQIWAITDQEQIDVIQKEVGALDELYIMDGHHRIASVSKLYQKYNHDNYRYCVSFLIDSNQLSVNPFHRLVQVDSKSFDELILELETAFVVEEIPDYAIRPEHKGEFVLRCSEGSFRLIHKHSSPLLDVQLLESTVLSRLFKIEDSRLDDRISFIASEEELSEAVIQSSLPGNYLFILYPCTFEEIAQISDRNEFMPPKSTFVEPKCDSGMFIQPYGNRV